MKFGQQHYTGTVVALRYMNVSFLPAVGIGIAATSLVGKYIGAGRPELVMRRTHQACILAMVYMGICGLLFLIFGRQLAEFYVRADETAVGAAHLDEIIVISRHLLMCAAAFQIFDAVAIVYCGGLQGAGDTQWKMWCAIILTWTLLIGGGYLVSENLPGLTSVGPWLVATLFVIIFSLLVVWRFESGRWKKIHLLNQPVDQSHGTDTLSEMPPVV
jgi:MATE family multidrug resistance protein